MTNNSNTLGIAAALCALFFAGVAPVRAADLHVAYPSGLFSNVDVKDAQAAVVSWGNSLGDKWGLPFSIVPNSYGEIDALIEPLERGELDMVALFPLDYLILKERVPIEPVLVPSFRGSATYHSVLLARRQRQIVDWRDLRGLQIAIARASRGSFVDVWMEVALLRRELEPSATFFSEIRRIDKTGQAVLLVFLQQIDACLVPADQFALMVELNPQLGRELVAVDTSPETCYGIICQRPQFDQARRETLEKNLIQMHQEALGQQIFTLFHYDQLSVYDPVYMEKTLQLLNEYNAHHAAREGRP